MSVIRSFVRGFFDRNLSAKATRLGAAVRPVLESLEGRRLLTAVTVDQFINTWEHLTPAARHDLAVLEYVYPQSTERLNDALDALGLAPLAPQAGTLPFDTQATTAPEPSAQS